MKKKTKLIAIISSFCLVLALGIFGVLAVSDLTFNMGGTVTFQAEGLNFTVGNGSFETTTGAEYPMEMTGKMQGFTMNTDKTAEDVATEVATWSGLSITLTSTLGDAVLIVPVTNNMQDKILGVEFIVSTLGSNNVNGNMQILVESGTVAYSTTPTEFKITFDIKNTSVNAGLTGFVVEAKFTEATNVQMSADTVLVGNEAVNSNKGLYSSSEALTLTQSVMLPAGETTEITLNLSNTTDKQMKVVVENSAPTGVTITAPSTIIPANTKQTYMISVSVAEGDNIDLSTLELSIILAENIINVADYMKDGGSWYYIEMGTYNGQAIRWQYVSADGISPYEYGTFPTSLTGCYVMTTRTNDQVYFNQSGENHGDIYANDYALSDLRSYLTGDKETDLVKKYKLDEAPIYELITPQSLEDLYAKICYDDNVTYESMGIPEDIREYYTSASTDANFNNATDKFFAPSRAELDDWGISYGWGGDNSLNLWGYWLRTPDSNYLYAGCTADGEDDDFPTSRAVNCANLVVRPAFAIGDLSDFKEPTYDTNGTVTFSAEGLDFTVGTGSFETLSGNAYRMSTTSGIMQGFTMSADTTEDDVATEIGTWAELNIVPNRTQGDVVLVVPITNNMQDKTLAVEFIVSSMGTENVNNNMQILVESGIVAYSTTPTEFKITFDIKDLGVNAGLTGFVVQARFTEATDVYMAVKSVRVGNEGVSINKGLYYSGEALVLTQNVIIPAMHNTEIKLQITNNTSKRMVVDVEYSELSGVGIRLQELTFAPNLQQTFSIYVSVYMENDVDLATLALSIKLTEDIINLTDYMKEDTENQYYYVEMGKCKVFEPDYQYDVLVETDNEIPIRWRYVSADGETPYEYGTFPTTLKGYYVMETVTYDLKEFNESSASYDNGIYANDYALSDLRSFLTGDKTTDFVKKYKLDEYYIYELITPQSLADLYSDICHDGSRYSDIPSNMQAYYTTPTTVATDKLFAPSHKEVSSLNISLDWAGLSSRFCNGYWFRSLGLSGSNTYVHCTWDWEITWGFTNSGATICVRPAFIIG